jgi:hypothetical protein
LHYNNELQWAEIGGIADPIEKQPMEYRLKVEKERFIEIFGLTVFELISISGLLVFIFHKRKENGNI